jgi:hypothetical protein
VQVAGLTGDRGGCGAPIKFTEGGDGLGCSEWPKGVDRRRGELTACWSGARRSGVEEIEGEEGVRWPLER